MVRFVTRMSHLLKISHVVFVFLIKTLSTDASIAGNTRASADENVLCDTYPWWQ